MRLKDFLVLSIILPKTVLVKPRKRKTYFISPCITSPAIETGSGTSCWCSSSAWIHRINAADASLRLEGAIKELRIFEATLFVDYSLGNIREEKDLK